MSLCNSGPRSDPRLPCLLHAVFTTTCAGCCNQRLALPCPSSCHAHRQPAMRAMQEARLLQQQQQQQPIQQLQHAPRSVQQQLQHEQKQQWQLRQQAVDTHGKSSRSGRRSERARGGWGWGCNQASLQAWCHPSAMPCTLHRCGCAIVACVYRESTWGRACWL